jgi:hypothetical protein
LLEDSTATKKQQPEAVDVTSTKGGATAAGKQQKPTTAGDGTAGKGEQGTDSPAEDTKNPKTAGKAAANEATTTTKKGPQPPADEPADTQGKTGAALG